MKRGDLFRVTHPSAKDPKRSRAFIIVSRNAIIASRFSTVICASVYSSHDGLSTQVLVGVEEGLKHDCSIHCDELVSLPKSVLTNYIGTLSAGKIDLLDRSLRIALDLPD